MYLKYLLLMFLKNALSNDVVHVIRVLEVLALEGFFLQALSDAPNECVTYQTDINSLSRV